MLAEGRVVELGAHHELLDRRGAYASLYGLYERLAPGGAARVVAGLGSTQS